MFMSVIIPYVNIGSELYASLQADTSYGITSKFNYLAKEFYLYIVIFIPKVALNLYSDLYFMDIGSAQFYSAALFAFVTVSILKFKKIIISNNVVLLILLYLIPMSAIALTSHRYFLPIYPLFVILYAERKYKYLHCIKE